MANDGDVRASVREREGVRERERGKQESEFCPICHLHIFAHLLLLLSPLSLFVRSFPFDRLSPQPVLIYFSFGFYFLFYFWHFSPLSFFGTHFFSSSLCAFFTSFIFDTFSHTEKTARFHYNRFLSSIYTNLRQNAAARVAKKNNKKKFEQFNSARFSAARKVKK